METRNNIRPMASVHPGKILKVELKERGIKQKDFAKQIGMQPTHLNALLQGDRSISPQLAIRIEEALGIAAKTWLNLQENYRLDQLRTSDLVDGYDSLARPSHIYALAESESYDYKRGRADLLEEILAYLLSQGHTREESLKLIGQA